MFNHSTPYEDNFQENLPVPYKPRYPTLISDEELEREKKSLAIPYEVYEGEIIDTDEELANRKTEEFFLLSKEDRKALARLLKLMLFLERNANLKNRVGFSSYPDHFGIAKAIDSIIKSLAAGLMVGVYLYFRIARWKNKKILDYIENKIDLSQLPKSELNNLTKEQIEAINLTKKILSGEVKIGSMKPEQIEGICKALYPFKDRSKLGKIKDFVFSKGLYKVKERLERLRAKRA